MNRDDRVLGSSVPLGKGGGAPRANNAAHPHPNCHRCVARDQSAARLKIALENVVMYAASLQRVAGVPMDKTPMAIDAMYIEQAVIALNLIPKETE